jgi:hypothetical protein
MPWVKAYTEMLDDTKLLRLNDACCWRFMQLILLAGVCDAEGLLTTGTSPMSLDDIAVRLRTRVARLSPQMDSLVNLGLVENTPHGYKVVKFAERQGRKQSEKREMWRAAASKVRQVASSSGPNWVQNDAELTQLGSKKDKKHSKTATNQETSSMSHAPRVEKSREEKHTGASAPVREPDLLFDAIAEVCQVDPKTSGPSIGKVKAALLKASPPYSPEEVRSFGKSWWAWDKRTEAPSLWNLQEKIGKVRANGHNGNSAAAQLRAEGYTDANGNPV